MNNLSKHKAWNEKSEFLFFIRPKGTFLFDSEYSSFYVITHVGPSQLKQSPNHCRCPLGRWFLDAPFVQTFPSPRNISSSRKPDELSDTFEYCESTERRIEPKSRLFLSIYLHHVEIFTIGAASRKSFLTLSNVVNLRKEALSEHQDFFYLLYCILLKFPQFGTVFSLYS